ARTTQRENSGLAGGSPESRAVVLVLARVIRAAGSPRVAATSSVARRRGVGEGRARVDCGAVSGIGARVHLCWDGIDGSWLRWGVLVTGERARNEQAADGPA